MRIAFERNLVNWKFLECLEKENGTKHGYIGESTNTMCHLAAEYGRLDVIRFIAEKNTSVLEKVDGFGRTVAHIAAEKGHKDVVLFVVNQLKLSRLR